MHPIVKFGAATALVVFATSAACADDAAVEAAVEKWSAQLTAKEVDARVEAAQALAAMGEQAAPAVVALRTNLSDKFYKVRAAAAIALGKIGPQASDATDALIEKLKDLSPSVRRAAAKALGRIGGDAAKRAIEELGMGLDHKLFKFRATAAESLGSMGLAAEPFVERVEKLAKSDKSKSVRAAAEVACEKIRKALEEERLRIEEEKKRLAALEALRKLEEARRKAAEEAEKKAAADAEAKRKAAEEAKRQAEEAKRKAEEEAKRKEAERLAKLPKCPACETPHEVDATRCPGCGDALVKAEDAEGRECPGCGATVAKDAKTCPDCETEIGAAGEKEAKSGGE